MKKLLLVIALVVIAACSSNGSRAEGAGPNELSDAVMTSVNMKGVAVARAAALTGAEVGCAALAQMVALAQEAAQSGAVIQDASWLAEWKTVREL
jgi:ABC-type Fe3+-hydroxamate transport system substrate-binding protein